jgi:hypothetical protein
MKEVTHISGEKNDKCDRPSRREASPMTSISDEAFEMRMPGVRMLEKNREETVTGIVELCDPSRELRTAGYRVLDECEARNRCFLGSARPCEVDSTTRPYLPSTSRYPHPHTHDGRGK